MKNIFAFGCFLFFFMHIAFAQSPQFDVMHLKNGSIIKGTIIEHVIGESYSIKTSDGSLFVFKTEEIEKFTKELPDNGSNIKESKSNDSLALVFRSKGFINYTSFHGLSIGDDDFTASFRSMFGLQLNEFVDLGLGIGIIPFYGDLYGSTYLDFRLNFLKNKSISPQYYINLGAHHDLYSSSPLASGIIAGTGFSGRWLFSKNAGITTGLGYELNGFPETASMFNFHFGFVFQ